MKAPVRPPCPEEHPTPRRLRVVGIGMGDPEHLTLQAVRALEDVDAVFVLDKRAETEDLVEARRRICAAHIRRPHRLVAVADPPRARDPADYGATVDAWHAARAERLEAALGGLGAGEVGAILVWGDPALYDSTLRVLDRIIARGRVALAYDVVPGLSSVQVLTARHRVPLNTVGGAVTITTGRRLAAAGWPAGADSVVVMLDGDPTFSGLAPDLTIFWGAYLGGPDEVLIAGRLGGVADEIRRVRAEARARHGWIMDIYLLRGAGG